MRHLHSVTRTVMSPWVISASLLAGACTGISGPPASGTTPGATPSLQVATPPNTGSWSPPPSGGQPSAPGASVPPDVNPSPMPSPSGITEAQAVAAVQAFAPHATGLHVTETETAAMGPTFRVQSADIVAEVDEATGEVRMFLDAAAMPTSRIVTLTKDEAQAAAAAWLAAHGVRTGGLSPATTLLDHGSTQEYAVDFQGRVNAARTPHRVTVSIDPATGAVFAFVLFTRPFVTPPAPRLTADEAVAAARSEEADPGATVTSTDLAIDFDAAGKQILVYELDLTRTDGFYVKVQVDALSGAVTVMGRG
ncbi:MAG: PepSY domain-containing protein [Candidatus Limnocylindrales bacterium]